jgi:voltage-gated potassium channel
MSSLLKKAFTDPRTNVYFWTHDFLALITIVSTVSIVLETVPALSDYQSVFNIIEWTAVVFFTFEYVVRLRLSKPWHHYVFSFYGIIDLVSILPTFLGIGNLTFLKSARVIRIIRLLRLIRLAKIRNAETTDIEQSMSVASLNITIYLLFLTTTLLMFGTILYLVEDASGVFSSIPSSMWWTFQVFVNARPFEIPATVLGGTAYVFARFVGLILLGALIGVVGNIMHHYLLSHRRRVMRR